MVRRSYHFNTESAARRDGIYLNDPCDMHFRQNSDYATAPYGIDSDQYNVLGIGDRPGYKPNSGSLPAQIIGGLHYHHNTVNANTNINADHNVVYVDTTGGNVTCTLPLLSTVIDDKIIYIHKLVRNNKVIITPSGADTISGFTGVGFEFHNPNFCVKLQGDKTAGVWRIIVKTPHGIWLGHEYPVNPGIVINSALFQVCRSYPNISLSNRDFMVLLSGSGWCDNVAFAKYEFAIFVDGAQGPSICYFHNEEDTYHHPFVGQTLLYNTAGIHTVDIRARRVSGANTLTLDLNDYWNVDLIQF